MKAQVLEGGDEELEYWQQVDPGAHRNAQGQIVCSTELSGWRRDVKTAQDAGNTGEQVALQAELMANFPDSKINIVLDKDTSHRPPAHISSTLSKFIK